MFPYIREFPPPEREYFWLQCDPPTTLCRISTYLRSDHGDMQLRTRYSKPQRSLHAELTALKYVANELDCQLPLHYNPKDTSTIFDLNMRINNSPCSKCHGTITEYLLRIKSLIPKVPFRFIMFFSNLYSGELTLDKTTELFSKWIIELVKYGIVVIICPIIVHKMVPKPKEISAEDVDEMVQLDRRCIDNFRGLLEEFDSLKNPRSHFNIEISHPFFRAEYEVYMRLFSWEKPHYISIFPKGTSIHIAKLVIESSKAKVSEKLAKNGSAQKPKVFGNTAEGTVSGRKDISKRFLYPRKVK